MLTFLTVVHVITIIMLVIVVLLQSGKGAEISASFGGSSQTVFGSSGGQNFFQKFTYGLAAFFMITSVLLTVLPVKTKKSVFDGYTPPATSTEPATSTPATTAPANTAPAEAAKPATETATPATTAPAAKK